MPWSPVAVVVAYFRLVECDPSKVRDKFRSNRVKRYIANVKPWSSKF